MHGLARAGDRYDCSVHSCCLARGVAARECRRIVEREVGTLWWLLVEMRRELLTDAGMHEPSAVNQRDGFYVVCRVLVAHERVP